MDRKDNLIPMSKRTPAERAELGRRGGIKSGESKRKSRTIREAARALLHSKGKHGEEVLDDMLLGLINEVIAEGNPQAFEKFMEYAGESPTLKMKQDELKLKKKEAARKNPEHSGEPTVFEQMVRELYERADEEAEAVSD